MAGGGLKIELCRYSVGGTKIELWRVDGKGKDLVFNVVGPIELIYSCR